MMTGETGKKMMIQKGYVPPTCTLHPGIAGPLIYSEISRGRSPCWGCNENRAICKGKMKKCLKNAGVNSDMGLPHPQPLSPEGEEFRNWAFYEAAT
ncbi:hypothetical protein [Desulfosudis oleivorans]|nr:hypothetical protein [Desulfosudis oleivorans]